MFDNNLVRVTIFFIVIVKLLLFSGPEGSFQTTLKKVDLNLVDHEECEKKLKKSKLGPRFKLHASLLCAGGQLGKDTCQVS